MDFGKERAVTLKKSTKYFRVQFRGGEWYLENRGSRNILVRSGNLGSLFDESRSLVFCFFPSRSLGVVKIMGERW